MRIKHSVETMHELALSKGIKFLSEEFLGVQNYHLWECANGHQWNSRPYNIKYIPYGKCPICSKKAKITLVQIKEMIESRGGVLLSENFIGLKSYIKIKCNKNHEWETQVANIRSGRWCGDCAKNIRLTIDDAHKLAQERGGKCLSTRYINANEWYEWQCSEGHIWKAKYGNIYSGNWCKKCVDSLGERICREFFNQLFNEEFISVKPEWLKNAEGEKLELDGYCEKLGIAFEHQGAHHYKKTPLFTKEDDVMDKRFKHDAIKKIKCSEKEIHLIEIPEINKELKPHQVKDYIKAECQKQNIPLPKNFDKIEVDYNKVYKTPIWKEKLEEQKQIARKKGGECLSTSYKNSNIKLEYRCKKQHVWLATPSKIKNGRWCPFCADVIRANKRRGTIEQMQKIAETNGGKCLSVNYTSSTTKLKWECAEKHTWDSVPNSIIQGTWCPTCSRKIQGETRRANTLNKKNLNN